MILIESAASLYWGWLELVSYAIVVTEVCDGCCVLHGQRIANDRAYVQEGLTSYCRGKHAICEVCIFVYNNTLTVGVITEVINTSVRSVIQYMDT